MYSFNLSTHAETQLANLAKFDHIEKIAAVVDEICDDPYKRAKPISKEKEVLGSYYVNAGGYYCIILQINDQNLLV